jgi:hypothetical protein
MYYYLDILKKKKHILYLNFIRLRIYYSNKPNDIIKILKNIYYFNGYNCSDEILNFLIECFTLYPLTENEMQKFSIWQQEYNNEGGINNYATFTFWISIIESLNNNSTLLLKE